MTRKLILRNGQSPGRWGRRGIITRRCAGCGICGGDHLWHDAAQSAEYHALARHWGLKYGEADFADPNMGHGAKPEGAAASG